MSSAWLAFRLKLTLDTLGLLRDLTSLLHWLLLLTLDRVFSVGRLNLNAAWAQQLRLCIRCGPRAN